MPKRKKFSEDESIDESNLKRSKKVNLVSLR